jgi:hypothetical protein
VIPLKPFLPGIFMLFRDCMMKRGCKTEKKGLTVDNNMGGAHRPYQFEDSHAFTTHSQHFHFYVKNKRMTSSPVFLFFFWDPNPF